MKVVLLRVGIDSGSGGMDGPLFADGSFEFVPIPDRTGLDERTYGNHLGRTGVPLVNWFPPSRQQSMRSRSMHLDPEFDTFTYGDPTRPKARLRELAWGDLLVFYAGLRGQGLQESGSLYLIGYFEVMFAGMANALANDQIELCRKNFHVRHEPVLTAQRERLVLVKGGDIPLDVPTLNAYMEPRTEGSNVHSRRCALS
jgi:hypothetical protein